MFTTCIKDTCTFFKTHWWVLALISIPLVLLSEAIRYWVGPIPMDGSSWNVVWIYVAEIVLVLSVLQIAVILYVHSAVSGSRIGVVESWRMGLNLLLPFINPSTSGVRAIFVGNTGYYCDGAITAGTVYIFVGRFGCQGVSESKLGEN
jgi:hypothetical protein